MRLHGRSFLVMLLVMASVFLVACEVPAAVKDGVQQAITTVGRGADGATLTLTATDATFDSGPATAHNAVLYLGGVDLTVVDTRCEPVNNGVGCDLGTITGSTEVTFTGTDVSVNVSYYRTDIDTPLFFYVRQPPN